MINRSKSGPVASFFLCVLLVAACGGSAETDPGNSQDEGDAAEVTPAEGSTPSEAVVADESNTAIDFEALPKGTVTVILDKGDFVMGLIKDFGEQSWCTDGSATILNTSGGQAVNLTIEGLPTPFSGKLEPAALNGADLPCQFEAKIENVPLGAPSYTVKQVGGKSSSVTASATLTGDELQAKGNLIFIE